MNKIVRINKTNIKIIIIVEIAPVLPNSKVVTKALGISATIPENIINDIPFPIPLWVICSPNHIKKIVPATIVVTVEILKNKPVFSVQYHPESNPGPQDSHYLFNDFINEIKKYAKKKRY